MLVFQMIEYVRHGQVFPNLYRISNCSTIGIAVCHLLGGQFTSIGQTYPRGITKIVDATRI